MNATDALKSGAHDVRLTHKDKWMVFDGETGRFTVYQRKRYARNTTVVVSTASESFSIHCLLMDEEEQNG